jgi:hypothetical protein
MRKDCKCLNKDKQPIWYQIKKHYKQIEAY